MNAAEDPTARLLAEAECHRLCVDFVRHIDARRYPEVLALFTADGVLDRMGNVSSGQEEIARFLEARDPAVATRHVCSNFSVDFTSADAASGTCLVLFFQGKAGGAGEPATQTAAPAVVEYLDQYQRTPSGWRIRERRIRMAMRPPAP